MLLNWIPDLLDDWTQTVVLDGEMSKKVSVYSGVPQGTVLSSILFLIYIIDFADYIQHSTLRLFADDRIIYDVYTEKLKVYIQYDLEAAGRWEQGWLMHFHPDKCNILNVTLNKSPVHFCYKLHNHILEKVKSSKYLGITIQNYLKWDQHINSISKISNQAFFAGT